MTRISKVEHICCTTCTSNVEHTCRYNTYLKCWTHLPYDTYLKGWALLPYDTSQRRGCEVKSHKIKTNNSAEKKQAIPQTRILKRFSFLRPDRSEHPFSGIQIHYADILGEEIKAGHITSIEWRVFEIMPVYLSVMSRIIHTLQKFLECYESCSHISGSLRYRQADLDYLKLLQTKLNPLYLTL